MATVKNDNDIEDEDLARLLQEEENSSNNKDNRSNSKSDYLYHDFITDEEKADEEYARLLQQTEFVLSSAAAGAGVGAGAGAGVGTSNDRNDILLFEDPLFGKMPKLKEGETNHRPQDILLFLCCPCFVGDVFSEERKGIFIKLARTNVSFWIFLYCIFIFFVGLIIGGFAPLYENPMFGPPANTLILLGAKDTYLIVVKWQIYRLITPIFLHAGFVHLFTNMFMLFRVGILLEREWGSKTYVAVYFATGAIGTMCSCVFLRDLVGVGASGALMGIMGCWLSNILCSWGKGSIEDNQMRNVSFLIVVANVGITISFSAIPFIDWAAHIGGLISGIVIGCYIWKDKIENEHRQFLLKRIIIAISFGSFIFFLTFFILLRKQFLLENKHQDI